MRVLKIIHLLFFISVLLSCNYSAKQLKEDDNARTIIDFANRKVVIPDTIKKVVCIRPGCMRLVLMAGGINQISGIEENESMGATFTHSLAYPELSNIDIIGPRFGGDHELIIINNPDLIFSSSTTSEAADALQEKLKIPIIVLEGGDFGENYWKFCKSLEIIGETLGTSEHVDSVLTYIENEKNDMKHRIEGKKVYNGYVGAFTYKGERDLTATDPYYPSFSFIGIHNVASDIDSTIVSPITGTFVDYEQIVEWNPDFIFVDRGGVAKADDCFRNKRQINNLLKAYRDNQIYVIWPYNNYHNNFEVILLNAWYMGKCIYPDVFEDISIRDKGNEMFTAYYGKPIFDEMEDFWGPYQQLDYQLPNTSPIIWKSIHQEVK